MTDDARLLAYVLLATIAFWLIVWSVELRGLLS